MEGKNNRMLCSLRQSLCLVLVVIGISQSVEITLPGSGIIDGTVTESHWTNKLIYQYQGIPFAEPPIGDLRFKRPVKYEETWEGVRNYSSFGPICPQGLDLSINSSDSDTYKDAEQNEDCLTLNVYTTKIDDGSNTTGLPVMVYIHGGAFRGGSARHGAPNYLLDKEDVVLVVPQYRLGPLGFLSLKTEEIPGNQGLLDIVLALEWVRDNIEHFGGDPDQITIFGQSAGAAAVTLMLFSPLVEEGLIKGVIAQSGSALGTWAVDPDPVTNGIKIARWALCYQEDLDLLAACLRKRPAQQILNAHLAFLGRDGLTGGRFVGGNHVVFDEAGDKSFLRKDPFVLLEEGKFKKVPMIAGVNKHEASGFFGLMYDTIIKTHNLDDDSDRTKFVLSNYITKMTLGYGGVVDRTGYTSDFIQDQYFGKDTLGNFTAMTPGLIDILSVSLLKACTFTMAHAMSRHNSTYVYSFNFFGRHSTFGPAENARYPFEGGIAHSDELYYLFPMNKELNEKEDAIAQKMAQFWTSFAVNGMPTAMGVDSWPSMSTANGPYLKIDNVPKVYDNFVKEEYMIASREGMKELENGSSATSIQVSMLALVLAFIIRICQ